MKHVTYYIQERKNNMFKRLMCWIENKEYHIEPKQVSKVETVQTVETVETVEIDEIIDEPGYILDRDNKPSKEEADNSLTTAINEDNYKAGIYFASEATAFYLRDIADSQQKQLVLLERICTLLEKQVAVKNVNVCHQEEL